MVSTIDPGWTPTVIPTPTRCAWKERFHRTDHNTIELSMTLTDPKAYAKPWVSDKFTFKLADGKTEMREDVCVPSVEAKYKETIREPAGGAAVIKK